jgi:hypothetical protein
MVILIVMVIETSPITYNNITYNKSKDSPIVYMTLNSAVPTSPALVFAGGQKRFGLDFFSMEI